MKKFVYIFSGILFLICTANPEVRAQQDPRLDGLDTLVQRLLKEWHAPGVGIAVVEKDKVLFSGGFGYRDFENKLPVTKNTQFAIGSSSKAFTCAVLGKLNSDDLLKFDEKVTAYLPGFEFYNDDMTRQITVRDIMCHRTGLPRHDFSWYLNPTSRDSLVQRIKYLEPSQPLRTRWQYNNFMFLLQGYLAEQLTGKSWEDNVRSMFFEPLGMRTSNFGPWDNKGLEVAKPYYSDKDDNIKPLDYYQIAAMGPAGSIYSNPEEMANWVMMWIHGGKHKGEEILPAGYISEAISSQMIISGGLPTPEVPDVFFSNYGFGWMLANYRGHYRVEHGGNIDGFSANVAFFPADSIGIVVIANQNGSLIPSLVRNYIADRLLDLPYKDWHDRSYQAIQKAKKAAEEAEENQSDNRKKGTVPTHALSAYAGEYTNQGYGTFRITRQNDTLMVHTVNMKMKLEHVHHNIFMPIMLREDIDFGPNNPFRFHFEVGLSGDISQLTIHGMEQGVEPIKFKKKPVEVEMKEDELAKYTGEYELAGTTIKAFIKGGVLIMQVPGQPDYPTLPSGDHVFQLKDLEGFSVRFEVNESDEVSAVYFVQPNGTFKATRK